MVVLVDRRVPDLLGEVRSPS